jgi:superfamily I DNA/RNA helicase
LTNLPSNIDDFNPMDINHHLPGVVYGKMGSGKTTSLVHALEKLILHDNIEPHTILILSGSMDGAKTLYQKAAQTLGESGGQLAVFNLKNWCLSVLRAYYTQQGLPPFCLYDQPLMERVRQFLNGDEQAVSQWMSLNNVVNIDDLVKHVRTLYVEQAPVLSLYAYSAVVVDNLHYFNDAEKSLLIEMSKKIRLIATCDPQDKGRWSFLEAKGELANHHPSGWTAFTVDNAEPVIEVLNQCRDRGLDYGDIAVLTHDINPGLESRLNSLRIPYTKVGDDSFFEKPELKTILDYLRAVYNPSDHFSVANVAAHLGIDPADIVAWIDEVRATQKPALPQHDALKDLLTHILSLQADYLQNKCTLANLVLSVADVAIQSDLDGLQEDDDFLNPEERINEFLHWIEEEQFSLGNLLDDVALQTPWQKTRHLTDAILVVPISHRSLLEDITPKVIIIMTSNTNAQEWADVIENITLNSSPFVSSTEETWKAGDRVEHQEWGEGLITNVSGEKDRLVLELAFGDEKKQVLAKYARLKRI